MAVSKVILNGTTLMDVTQDTVAANKLLSGETAHKNDGTEVTGNIATKSSSDLTVSGATVTAPAGYYSSAASKSVASGTAGTPTATKGTVSNHAISVTPSVTNTAGYISGGTKTGTAVSVSASELVSGTLSVTSSGTKDVTNYASASIPAGTEGTPAATKGTVSNHAISVTPSVTNTAGYIAGGTKTGTAVSVSAAELVSGSQTITENGTVDVTNLAEVVVDIDTSPKYTATISGTGDSALTFAQHDNVAYYADGDSFEFSEGDTIRFRAQGMRAGGSIVIDGVTVAQDNYNAVSYNYTAPASDIAISLYYSSTGSVTVETQSSESITVEPLSVTANGTYTAPSGTAYSPVTVNVPSGLEYEEGTWNTSEVGSGVTEDVHTPTIPFANSHSEPPVYIAMVLDSSYVNLYTPYYMHYFEYTDVEALLGRTIIPQNRDGSPLEHYVRITYAYRTTSSTALTFGSTGLQYNSASATETRTDYVTASAFMPHGPSGYKWRYGERFKWIAIWA